MADKRLEIVLAAKDATRQVFKHLDTRLTMLRRRVFSFQGTIATLAGGYGLGKLAESTLDVADSFEQLEVKLDTLTRGRGKETLEDINRWALDMPINTGKAVDAFTMMMSYGLDPTIHKLGILVDTATIFGEDAMPRIARALGQISTKGKLSAQDLNQLTEVGINARKYLTQSFGMTVEELQKSQVSVDRIIQAIMDGMERDFGGTAKKQMESWRGLKATFVSYVTEIERAVMGAGIFDELKTQLGGVNTELKTWLETNQDIIKQNVPVYIDKTKSAIKGTWNFLSQNDELLEYGLLGLAIWGRKGAIIGAGIGAYDQGLKALFKWMEESQVEIQEKKLKAVQDEIDLLETQKAKAEKAVRNYSAVVNNPNLYDQEKAPYQKNLEFYKTELDKYEAELKSLYSRKKNIDDTITYLMAPPAVKPPAEKKSGSPKLDIDKSYAPAGGTTAPAPTPKITFFDSEEEQKAWEKEMKLYEQAQAMQDQAVQDTTKYWTDLADKRKQIKADLTDSIKGMTLDETQYEEWAYSRQVEALKQTGVADQEILDKMAQEHELKMKKMAETTEKTFSQEMKTAFKGWADDWSRTLTDIVFETDASFGDIAQSFERMLAQMAIQKKLVEPVFAGFEGILDKIWPGAKGMVMGNGRIVPMGKGGILTGPTLFPLKDGAALGGEAGFEGLLPLDRNRRGQLAVNATGLAGTTVEIHIHNNAKGTDVKVQQTTQNGQPRLDIMIDEIMSEKVLTGKTGKTLRTAYNLNPMLISR